MHVANCKLLTNLNQSSQTCRWWHSAKERSICGQFALQEKTRNPSCQKI